MGASSDTVDESGVSYATFSMVDYMLIIFTIFEHNLLHSYHFGKSALIISF